MVVGVSGRDEYGNTVMVGGVELEAQIQMLSAQNRQQPMAVGLEVVDRRNGTFEVAHEMKVAGEFTVRAANGNLWGFRAFFGVSGFEP